ncbi:MAG: hypothetical protein AABY01_03630 [Nanoarchaeota archaeon]
MTTTIQVSDMTKQLLDQLKAREHADSFDAVVEKLAREKMAVPKSMFGSAKGLGPWRKEDRDDRDL